MKDHPGLLALIIDNLIDISPVAEPRRMLAETESGITTLEGNRGGGGRERGSGMTQRVAVDDLERQTSPLRHRAAMPTQPLPPLLQGRGQSN